MTAPARVLLIGNDQAPLESIAEVLRNFWSVGTAVLDRGVTPVLAAELVVVCDMSSERELQLWVERVRQASPGMLVVKLNGYDSGPHGGADATIDEAHGPAALVSTIYELLTERGLPSRSWGEMQQSVWVQ